MDMNRTAARVVVLGLIGASLLAACSGPGSSSEGASAGLSGGGGSTGGSEQLGAGNASGRASVNQAADVATVLQSGGGEGALGGPGVPSIGPSVVKTATVQVAVPEKELSEALGAATAIAARYGGFVESKTTDDSGDRSGVVVMRVPAGEFEAALQELQDAGDTVRENVSGQDVSEEFVDLEARLRNWRAQEAVLLRLMSRAKTVVGTIRVQSELSVVQLETEKIRGRLRFLEDQASFGTISATYVTSGAPAPGDGPPGTIARAWNEALGVMLSVVSALIVSLGFLVPAAVLGAVGLVAYRGLRRPATTP